MKTASKKAKGRNLQNHVRDELLESFSDTGLEEDDIKTAIMGESGEDIKLSPAARRVIPYSFECKNQERLNIWSAWAQANANKGPYEPMIVIKKNGIRPLVVVDAEHYLEMIKNYDK